MMTLERASELVSKLEGEAKIHLFCHFEEFFGLDDESGYRVMLFAQMCDFHVVTKADILEEDDYE